MAIKAAFAEEKDAGPVEAPSSDYDYSEMGYTEPVSDSEDAEASEDDIEIPEPEYASGPDDEPVTEKSEAEDEPAAEAEDSAEEEPVVPPKGEEFPPELLEIASQMGFTYQDVKSLGTAQALETAIRREQARWNYQGKPPEPDAEPETPAYLAEIDALVADGFDPEYAERLKGMLAPLSETNTKLTKQIEEMRGLQGQQQEALQRQQFAAEAKQLLGSVDGMLAALPKNYQKVLGTGPTIELKRTDPAFGKREQVINSYLEMRKGWQWHGATGPDDPKLFRAALTAALGDHSAQEAREEVKQQMRKNGKQVIARPTNAGPEGIDPREKAYRFAEEHPLFARNG